MIRSTFYCLVSKTTTETLNLKLTIEQVATGTAKSDIKLKFVVEKYGDSKVNIK